MTENRFGIIRYADRDGPCAFDGWYDDRKLAEPVYVDWCREYPGWIVALIETQPVDVCRAQGAW